MFGRAIERAVPAGYRRYEVSNYAVPGFESRHNQIYWRNEDYFGFGAGAASYRSGVRSMNERLPGRFADKVNADGTATVEQEQLTPADTMGETMMVGLRMASGIDLGSFYARFGVSCRRPFRGPNCGAYHCRNAGAGQRLSAPD